MNHPESELQKACVSFHVTGKLTDLNEYINQNRGNKYTGAKTKKMDTFICQQACKHLKGKIDPYGKYFIEFAWFQKTKKKDPDNVCFAKKFILDGMVKAGVISNDGANNIAGFADTFIYGVPESVLVTIKEVENYLK